MSSPVLSGSFTPSELVILRGDEFAKKTKLGGIKILGNDFKLFIPDLSKAMLTAGILANHEAGTVRLELTEKKALLRKVNRLVCEPAGGELGWPTPSLEADLQEMAMAWKRGGREIEISDLLYAWLKRDSTSPWESAIEFVMERMAARGVLERQTKKKLKIFNVTHYELPESTAALAAQQSVASVRQMSERFEIAQPEAWKLLEKQIKKAISRRVEQPDVDWD